MSNRTYACFDCRTTGRVPTSRITMNCRSCRKPAHHIYYKFRIPSRSDDRGWRDLERKMRPMNLEIQSKALRRVHDEQVRIARLVGSLSESSRSKRSSLERRLRALEKEREDWLKWSAP